MKKALIKDWMVRNVVTVTPDTTFPEAQRLMIEHGIRRLPVVESGRLVGIVTRGDVQEAEELGDMLAKIKLGQIMTPKPVTISQEATIGEAAEVMLERKINGLPVVDSAGKLVGIITESDIFRLVVSGLEQRIGPKKDNIMDLLRKSGPLNWSPDQVKD